MLPHRYSCLIQVGLLLVLTSVATASLAEDSGGGKNAPVLVELFTSEGCSSCPPADRLLRELVEKQPLDGVEVLGLSFHVDYWNHLGWRDPFSSAAWSERQRRYATELGERTVYTPQLIVGGKHSVVGSDRRKVLAAIQEVTSQPPQALEVTLVPAGSTRQWRVTVKGRSGGAARSPDSRHRLSVALVEDGLSVAVRRGENAGRALSHVAVVRHLQNVSLAADDELDAAETVVAVEEDWKPAQLRAVAWVEDEQGRLLAAGQTGRP